MDHDNTGGAVSDGCVDCGHNHCDFDLSLSYPFEERYNYNDTLHNYSCTCSIYYNTFSEYCRGSGKL